MIATHQVLVKHPHVRQLYEGMHVSNQHACTRVIPLAHLKNRREFTTDDFGFCNAPFS